jgi:hypothetical protein
MSRSLAHTRSHAKETSFSSTTPRLTSAAVERDPRTALVVTTTAAAAPRGAAMNAS